MQDLLASLLNRLLLLSAGCSIGGIVSFLYGGDARQVLLWLVIFVIADYCAGTFAALRLGEWTSALGAKGLFKKVFVLFLVALCHGLDTMTPNEMISLRDICAFAFCANEFGSIIENVDRAGFGDFIPTTVRKAFALLKAEDEKKYDQHKDSEER